jgi:death on curing protein
MTATCSEPLPSNTWRWVTAEVVFAIHDCQVAEHSGLDGITDRGAIESGLARPRNLVVYGAPDAADLAAAYAYGLIRNHGFADGNKRLAWVVARLFLADNNYRLQFEKAAAVRMMEALAACSMSEPGVAAWFRERLSALVGSAELS